MKMKFEVIKDTPRIKFSVTRDSVCAADDVDAPHEKYIHSYSFTDPVILAQQVASEYGLPNVSGGKATWVCHLNGDAIAVMAQQWKSGKPIKRMVEFQSENRIHYKYHGQSPPESYIRRG